MREEIEDFAPRTGVQTESPIPQVKPAALVKEKKGEESSWMAGRRLKDDRCGLLFEVSAKGGRTIRDVPLGSGLVRERGVMGDRLRRLAMMLKGFVLRKFC